MNHFHIQKPHFLADFNSSSLSGHLIHRKHHGLKYYAISSPFHFWFYMFSCKVLSVFLQSLLHIVLRIQFININNLLPNLQSVSTDGIGWFLKTYRYTVVSEEGTDRGKIVFLFLKDSVRRKASIHLSHNAVSISLWIVSRIHKESIFHSFKIPAGLQDLFHEEHSSFFNLPDLLRQEAFFFQLYHG